MATEDTSSPTQESLPIGPSVSSVLTEPEAPELTTTIDPSYIIQLIRQLLPTVHGKDLGKCSSAKWQDSLITNPLWNVHSEMATNNEKLLEHSKDGDSALDGASAIMDEKSTRCLDIQEGVCNRLDPEYLLPQRGRALISDTAGPCPSSGDDNGEYSHSHTGEVNKNQPGVLPQNSGEHFVVESTVREAQQEEAGCVLWDLAASQSHAEFMVKNHILDVLLAILSVPHSDRAREICLGILGNLACHAVAAKAIVQTPGLPNEIMQNLFINDSPSLSEACRLLSAGLHSEEVDSWVTALNAEEILGRILWIAANTMNSLLLEKVTELLLAMVDCPKDTASILLSGLVRLGLTAVLTDLVDSEIGAVNEGTCSHGNIVLDTLLQIAEVLSLSHEYAAQLAATLKLFSLACQVVRLSGRDEVGPAGISASVLVANLLAEKDHLIQEVYRDASFLRQVLELLPCAGDDPGARNALWSILGRLSNAFLTSSQDFHATSEPLLVLAERCELLIGDLQDHLGGKMEGLEENESTKSFKAKLVTVNSLLQTMEDWAACSGNDEDSDMLKTLKSSCCRLEGWLREADLNAISENDVKFGSHENE